jgi:phosphohistidine phosphatase SixA
MAELGIDISSQRSKTTTDLGGQHFDYAVTVCDDAKEACPYYANADHQVHWGFDDPSSAAGSEEEQLAVFRRVRDEIAARIDKFVALRAARGRRLGPMEPIEDSADFALYLLRHAHAGNSAAWTGDDAERPLSDRGKDQARRLGSLLAARGVVPDAIVSSPKVRARQSANLVADALGLGVANDDRLAEMFDLDALAAIMAGAGGTSLLLVGHDPDFSDMLATLVGAAELPMRKGAIARVDVALPLGPGCGVLRYLVPPELLPDPTED